MEVLTALAYALVIVHFKVATPVAVILGGIALLWILRSVWQSTELRRLQHLVAASKEELDNVITNRVWHLSKLDAVLKSFSGSGLDGEALSNIATEKVLEIIPCDVVGLWVDNGQTVVTAYAGELEALEGAEHYVDLTGAQQTQEVFLDKRTKKGLERRFCLLAPVSHAGVKGAIVLCRSRGEFNESQRTLLEEVGKSLAVAIRNALVYTEALREAEEDAMTGLLNHKSFQLRLTEAVQNAETHKEACSVVMLDMDSFKQLNDTYGHMVGDQALKTVAACLKQNSRSFDLLARYGGDEFAIIMPRAGVDQAAKALARTQASLQEHGMTTAEGQQITLAISFGISSYPIDGNSPGELVSKADQELYRAKALLKQDRSTESSGSEVAAL